VAGGYNNTILTIDERPSDSPFVERIWRAHNERGGPFSSIAMSHWEMVVTKYNGQTPTQIMDRSEQLSVLYKTEPFR
jgi:hypothetical protein